MTRNLSDQDIREMDSSSTPPDRRKEDRRKVHTMLDPAIDRRKGGDRRNANKR